MDTPTLTLEQIIVIIEGMDAHEADTMGVSCQYFARKLTEEITDVLS